MRRRNRSKKLIVSIQGRKNWNRVVGDAEKEFKMSQPKENNIVLKVKLR